MAGQLSAPVPSLVTPLKMPSVGRSLPVLRR